MRKFAKLLTLVLALAAIITVFTMVSFAATPTKPAIVAPAASHVIGTSNLSTLTEGKNIANDAAKIGKFTAAKADDGNIYALNEYETATGTSKEQWLFYPTYARDTYSILNYKYYVLDYDLMTPTGSFAGMTIQADIWNDKATLHYGANIDQSKIGFDNTPYKWQHVTYVMEFAGDGVFIQHYYINGEHKFSANMTSANNGSWTALNGNYTNVIVGQVRFMSVNATNASAAYDNFHSSFFPANYSLDEIANYFYTGDDYVFPYGRTEAKIGDTFYDDVYKAIGAASNGTVVKLAMNATKTVDIDELAEKGILIDTNVYDKDGNPTGEFYTYDYKTEKGMEPVETEVGSGIFGFAKSSNAVDIHWDPICTDECNCYGAHSLNTDVILVLGEVPEFTKETPADSEVNGLLAQFVGWSYEKGGSAEELVAITEEDVERGYINLYPVYKFTQYDFSLTVGDTVTYYTADQYTDLFVAAQRADNTVRTVTLLRDAEVYDRIYINVAWSQSNVRVVFDLRGNTLTRVNLVGEKFKYDAASGTYIADGELTVPDKGNNIFYCNASNNYFTITSSVGRGAIVTYKVSGDIFYDENGKMQRYEAETITGSSFMDWYNSGNRHVVLENIDIYANNVFNAAGGSNTGCTLDIKNVNYYATYGSDKSMAMTLYFESIADFKVNVSDSLFYFPSGIGGTTQFFRLADRAADSKYDVTFDNCDFIGMSKMTFFQFYSLPMKLNPDNAKVQINNTRFYNAVGNGQITTYFGDGTLYNSVSEGTSTVTPGYVSAPVTKSVSYKVPTNSAVTIDAETKQPVISFEKADQNLSFAFQVKKCSEVPESVSDARFSMLYYTNFNMVVYIPVKDGMTNVVLSGFTQSADTVKIDGNEYYVFTKASTTTGVSDTVTAKLSYKVNGGSYRQTYKLSALVYADLMLNDPWMEVETKAIANMVRYIKEARLAAGLTAGAEFDELIALGNLAELGAKEDYADTTVDYSALAGYVSEVKFMLDGTNAAYLITLTSADVDVSVKFVGGETIALADSTATENAKYTTGTRVYDVATKAIEITVTVPAAEGGEPTVISGTYSVKAYINATDNALAKAMYEFGIAADAYRSFLIEAAEND